MSWYISSVREMLNTEILLPYYFSERTISVFTTDQRFPFFNFQDIFDSIIELMDNFRRKHEEQKPAASMQKTR